MLITTALMFIGGLAKIINNLNHLNIVGDDNFTSPARNFSIWAWRYFTFLAHWNLAMHYYTASVTCTEILEARAVKRIERNLRIVFWTFTTLALAATGPFGHKIAVIKQVPLKASYLVLIMIPYTVTFVFLILALKNIRAFLIKYCKRMKLHKRWIIAHIIAFSLFFVTTLIAKTYLVFTVTQNSGVVLLGVAYVLSFISNLLILGALWKMGYKLIKR